MTVLGSIFREMGLLLLKSHYHNPPSLSFHRVIYRCMLWLSLEELRPNKAYAGLWRRLQLWLYQFKLFEQLLVLGENEQEGKKEMCILQEEAWTRHGWVPSTTRCHRAERFHSAGREVDLLQGGLFAGVLQWLADGRWASAVKMFLWLVYRASRKLLEMNTFIKYYRFMLFWFKDDEG